METRAVSRLAIRYTCNGAGLTQSLPAIQAPLSIPPVHPKDKPLLRPLSDLGKPKYATGGHSFLRRTEYISTGSSRTTDNSTPKSVTKQAQKVRRQVDTAKDDPVTILRAAVKGFDIAYPQDAYTGPDAQDNKIRGSDPTPAELEAWRNPKHPTHRELILLDAYPFKPDLNAFTDNGSFQLIKFTANPTPVTESYDTRLDVGFLVIKTTSAETEAAVTEEFNARLSAHQDDPSRNPAPGPMNPYELFLPNDENTVIGIKRKFDVDDPDKNESELYGQGQADGASFRYDHIRAYDTARSTMNLDHPYKDVALALHDPQLKVDFASASSRLEKAAYYYPIQAKQQIRPRRNQTMAKLGLTSQTGIAEESEIDALAVKIGDPSNAEAEAREQYRVELETSKEDEQQEAQE